MHHRLSLWMAFFAFVAVGAVRAQTPAMPDSAAPAQMAPGQIVAAKVTGVVSMVLNGTTTPLKNGDAVSEKATVVTANDSSVILVFSNGATTQLGADTTLIIEEFLQDPFKDDVKVAELTEEPTKSHTRLHLTKGELVGKVVHLHHDQGSTFTVQTPVGAAGIRGTTFRIVFRPSGSGQAFAVFSLSTAEGNVNFQQNGQPGQAGGNAAQGGQGQGNAQAQADTQGQSGTQGQGQAQAGESSTQGQGTAASPNAGSGNGNTSPGGGVAVTTGQEVVVTLSVEVNQATGQVTLTAPPTITSTQPISTETQTLITQQAQAAVTATVGTTFSPTPPPASTPTTTTTATTEGEKKSDKTEDKKDSSQSEGDTSGGTSSTTSSSSTTSTTSTSTNSTSPTNTTTGDSTTNTSNGTQSPGTSTPSIQIPANPSPGIIKSAPQLTPDAGKGP